MIFLAEFAKAALVALAIGLVIVWGIPAIAAAGGVVLRAVRPSQRAKSKH